jgi:hypothetical protein
MDPEIAILHMYKLLFDRKVTENYWVFGVIHHHHSPLAFMKCYVIFLFIKTRSGSTQPREDN